MEHDELRRRRTALLRDARDLMAKMGRACEAEGRSPETLRHSFLLFDAEARESGGRFFFWESTAAFEDVAGQLFDMGYDEIGVYYPIDAQREVFEDAAATVLPTLRNGGARPT